LGVSLSNCAVCPGADFQCRKTMDKFDSVVGLKYLRGMHLNDSKAALGSKKDRHENIGLGEIGFSAFAHIVSDPRTRGVPLILETPSHESDGDVWRAEITALHAVVPDVDLEHVGSVEGGLRVVKEAVAAVEKKPKKENKTGKKRRHGADNDEENDTS